MIEAFGEVEDSTIDERDAFLLGNQGPDPLFFLLINPKMSSWRTLGSRMHKERTTDLIAALHRFVAMLDEYEQPIGNAYAQGFLCHYMLDSMMHPLVYSRVYALCDAGVDNLTRNDAREVHAEIEREFDEMVLTAKRDQTIAEYPAVQNTLEASPETLAIVQKMYAYLALSLFGEQIPLQLFPTAVECYRITLGATHSPLGIKRALAMLAERQVRDHSYFGAIAHKAHKVHDSWFANTDHEQWPDPYSGATRTESFWDIYREALGRAAEAIAAFAEDTFTVDDARAITHDINFSGASNVATIVVHD